MRTLLLVSLLLLLIAGDRQSIASAQGDANSIVVPNLTGLNASQAAAQLNIQGLRLGAESYANWSEASGLSPSTIQSQTPAAGEMVSSGSAINVTILRPANAVLFYDGNDFTLVNELPVPIDLNGISFRTVGGAVPASFDATRWTTTLRENNCAQVWSVPRGTAKPLDECDAIQQWMTTNNPANHFWTPKADVTQFEVVDNGTVIATCNTAVSEEEISRCEVFMRPSAPIIDATNYLYLVYTADRLAIINQTPDRWMLLSDVIIYNANPNLSRSEIPLPVTDTSLYGESLTYGDINKLAVNQCVMFTTSALEGSVGLESCDIIAQLTMDPNLIFWSSDFSVSSPSRFDRTPCPAAVPGRASICIVSR